MLTREQQAWPPATCDGEKHQCLTLDPNVLKSCTEVTCGPHLSGKEKEDLQHL